MKKLEETFRKRKRKRKGKGKVGKTKRNKKSTLRAFASRAKNYSFQHFGDFSTDPGRPAIKFFRNGLNYAHIFPKKIENGFAS